jgi:hypothetical protein
MARWTVDHGWTICLGAGFETSWWDDQCGNDFLLETQAREACGDSETVYARKVLRLQWLARFWNEKPDVVRRYGNVDPDNPWYSLEMMQRRRLAASRPTVTKSQTPRPVHGSGTPNKIAIFRERQSMIPSDASIECDNVSGTIVIPAASCTSPTTTTEKVMFLPCFIGGQQLYIMADAEVEYKVPADLLHGTEVQNYNLTCRVSTAHRQEQPLSLTIGPNVYEITLPYTMALWGNSEPITISLDGAVADQTMKFSRNMQQFGFSMRDITLIPT